MRERIMAVVGMAGILLAAGSGVADITIDTIPVGNAGNTGEWSGESYGGYGPNRICGAVDYDFNIGTYEVTAGEYTAFLTAVAGVDTYVLYNPNMSYGSGISRSGGGTVGNPYTYTVDPAFVHRPVNYVSWGDAARFTNWLTNGQGNGSTETGAYDLNGAMTDDDLLAVVVPSAAQRATWSTGAKSYFLLTSEDEWYKAAYHDSESEAYFDYPTSSNTAPGRDMAETINVGNNANYYTGSGANPIDSGKYTTVAGEFELSYSPYGTFDQGGNVWEWNESIVSGSYRGLRGGAFDNHVNNLHAAARAFNSPTYESYDIGFRVSEVPEPASIAVLALGSIGVLLRRQGSRR